MSKASIEQLEKLRTELKNKQKAAEDLAEAYLADAAQIASVIRTLEKGDLERLPAVITSLDTAVREQVYPLLSEREQKKSGWLGVL